MASDNTHTTPDDATRTETDESTVRENLPVSRTPGIGRCPDCGEALAAKPCRNCAQRAVLGW